MSNLNHKIQQWRALQSWERSLLVKLFFLLPLGWLVYKAFGFNRARQFAEPKLPADSTGGEQSAVEYAQRCAELTAIAARHGLYKANCLHQSLALCRVLRQQAMPARIRIGMRPNAQPFQAHAWVELDGIALGQSVDEYKAFDSLASVSDTTNFK